MAVIYGRMNFDHISWNYTFFYDWGKKNNKCGFFLSWGRFQGMSLRGILRSKFIKKFYNAAKKDRQCGKKVPDGSRIQLGFKRVQHQGSLAAYIFMKSSF